MTDSGHCPLPYPHKFQEASGFASKHVDDLTEESKLLLYSLHQQATVGPCNEPKPWGWSVVNNAKWQSWKQLGDMPAVEAMRLYVRTLEEEVPDWWPQHQAAGDIANGAAVADSNTDDSAANGTAKAAPAGEAAPAAAAAPQPPPGARLVPKSRSVTEVVVEGSWVSPYISSDKRPPPRYEHATALIGSELFVIGGNYGGRYLSDSWALNLENLTWKSFPPSSGSKSGGGGGPSLLPSSAPAPLPAIAGHVAVAWQGNVVVVGGHLKAKEAVLEMPVRLLDTKSGAWSAIQCGTAEEDDDVPRPRGGHSGVLLGSKLYIFGGEDVLRRPLAELVCLDLDTMQWSVPETAGTPPGPRSAHAAALYRGRYMVVFGGGSVAHCNNELHVLDLLSLEWSVPDSEGPVPPPRAGHAGAILGDIWFLVGGGNNTSGCADMYALDLSALEAGTVQWTLVGNTPVESAIASEGLSLLPVPMAGCMISFGGYNGRYHNAVHVYRPEGYLMGGGGTAAAAAGKGGAPAALQQAGSAGSAGSAGAAAVPLATGGSAAQPAAAAGGAGGSGAEHERLRAELDAARKETAAAKEAVAQEMALMRRQLDSAQAAAADADKALEEARAALEAEQAKGVRLEVELAEARQSLERMEELDRELQKYRHSTIDKKGSGLWGYISGQ
ncbi:hypothetical protein D9Q98_004902 [Chlorella vulgaris]|uniref:ACB domain-containing protein n=1 Tax=Chlorella vulgaris TaxID=3077 RepID=A0A9D4TN94_CHLVU|nr:hypothetical protein D9Q98_004902 [Chlorella vulgaris]